MWAPPTSTSVDSPAAAIARSASLIALAIHSPPRSRRAPERAVTSPPTPRRYERSPVGASSKVTGPRFETTTTGGSTALRERFEQREVVVEVASRKESFFDECAC